MQNRNRLIATGLGALTLAVAIAVWHARSEEEEQTQKKAAAGVQPASPSAPAQAPAPAPPPTGPMAAAQNAPPDAPPPPPVVQAAVARMNEAVLMARLRELAATDSVRAIEMARAGNKKFPDSPDAPERESILIHALVTENQLSDARAEAEYMVNHYPDSTWVRQIEGFTGAHRHRNIRVNDAGQLEYY